MLLLLTGCEARQVQEIHLQEVFPPVTMDNVALFRVNNLPVTVDYFRNHWTLVVLDSEDCKESCIRRLEHVNRIKAVQKLLFADGLADQKRLRELIEMYPQIAMTSGTTMSSVENFSRQFDLEDLDRSQKYNYVYIINPGAQLVYVVSDADVNQGLLESDMPLLLGR
jgi:hypothetical protein